MNTEYSIANKYLLSGYFFLIWLWRRTIWSELQTIKEMMTGPVTEASTYK